LERQSTTVASLEQRVASVTLDLTGLLLRDRHAVLFET
jgi:hypothetical protein